MKKAIRFNKKHVKDHWTLIEVGLILMLFIGGMLAIQADRRIDPSEDEQRLVVWVAGNEALLTFVQNTFKEQLADQQGPKFNILTEYNVTIINNGNNITAHYEFASQLTHAVKTGGDDAPVLALVDSRIVSLLGASAVAAKRENVTDFVLEKLDPVAEQIHNHHEHEVDASIAFYAPLLMIADNDTLDEFNMSMPMNYSSLLQLAAQERENTYDYKPVGWDYTGSLLPLFISDAVLPAFGAELDDPHSWFDAFQYLSHLHDHATPLHGEEDQSERAFIEEGGIFLFASIQEHNALKRHTLLDELTTRMLPSGPAGNHTPVMSSSWVVLGNPTAVQAGQIEKLLTTWYSEDTQYAIFDELGEYAVINGSYDGLPAFSVDYADKTDFVSPLLLAESLYMPPATRNLDLCYQLEEMAYENLVVAPHNETSPVIIDNQTIIDELDRLAILLDRLGERDASDQLRLAPDNVLTDTSPTSMEKPLGYEVWITQGITTQREKRQINDALHHRHRIGDAQEAQRPLVPCSSW